MLLNKEKNEIIEIINKKFQKNKNVQKQKLQKKKIYRGYNRNKLSYIIFFKINFYYYLYILRLP